MKSVKGLTKKIMPGATMVAGGVIASKANGMLADKIANGKVRLGVITGLGIFMMTQRSATVQNLGAGITTVGGMKLIGEVAPQLGISDDFDLSGLFDVNVNGTDVINGDDDMYGVNTINGDGDGNDN